MRNRINWHWVEFALFIALLAFAISCDHMCNSEEAAAEPDVELNAPHSTNKYVMKYTYGEQIADLNVDEYQGELCLIGISRTTPIEVQSGGICTYTSFGYHVWYKGGSEVALKYDLSNGAGPWVESVPLSASMCERGNVCKTEPNTWEPDPEGNAILCMLRNYFREDMQWVIMTLPEEMGRDEAAFTDKEMDALERSFPQKDVD